MFFCGIPDKSLKAHPEKIDDVRIARHMIHSDRYKQAYFFLLAFNQQGIIARMKSESKGKLVRSPLTDAAVVVNSELREATCFDRECLIACGSNSIRRFGMQDVVSRHERDFEVTLRICFDLYDPYAVRAVDR